MIPQLVLIPGSPWKILPPGVHAATLQDVGDTFATNPWRRSLFNGLVDASGRLRSAGCPAILLDGSFVSSKPNPGDYDACWDPTGVDPAMLDPVFAKIDPGRAAQKAAFKGEFFPSTMTCLEIGKAFADFFQIDRFTGSKKGILSISLVDDPILVRRVQA